MKVGDKVRVIVYPYNGHEGIVTNVNAGKPYTHPIDVALPVFGVTYFAETELEVI